MDRRRRPTLAPPGRTPPDLADPASARHSAVTFRLGVGSLCPANQRTSCRKPEGTQPGNWRTSRGRTTPRRLCGGSLDMASTVASTSAGPGTYVSGRIDEHHQAGPRPWLTDRVDPSSSVGCGTVEGHLVVGQALAAVTADRSESPRVERCPDHLAIADGSNRMVDLVETPDAADLGGDVHGTGADSSMMVGRSASAQRRR